MDTIGFHRIAPLGSTGVMPYLDDAEKEALTKTCIQQVADKNSKSFWVL
ncbi:MAG: hypothetical protein QM654_09400 [Dysgonamonadaceae bacterium]